MAMVQVSTTNFRHTIDGVDIEYRVQFPINLSDTYPISWRAKVWKRSVDRHLIKQGFSVAIRKKCFVKAVGITQMGVFNRSFMRERALNSHARVSVLKVLVSVHRLCLYVISITLITCSYCYCHTRSPDQIFI